MEDSCHLSNCNEHDVLLFGCNTCKLDQLRGEVSRHFDKYDLGKRITDSLISNKHLHVLEAKSGVSRGVGTYYSYNQWFDDGVKCEILKVGAKGWQKGKIRINLNVSLEFCPDESEVEETPASNEQEIGQPKSPLDDIRQMIKNV